MKTLSALLITLLSMNAFAGSAAAGTVSAVHFFGNGQIIFYTSGARTAVPTCAVNQPSRFVFDASTAAGKNQLAGIMAAYVTGKQVTVFGKGTCVVEGSEEDLSYFYAN